MPDSINSAPKLYYATLAIGSVANYTMFRLAPLLMLAVLWSACSLMPPRGEHIRARQMEEAVVPMAATALEAGQLETARRLYRRLLAIDADSVEARVGLGDVAMREQETEAAARWYLAALTRAKQPAQRHAALLAHGRAALAAGQIEAARESFMQLANPEENAPRTSAAWGHNGVGLTLLLDGDPRGAVAEMEQAVLRAPEEERFRSNLDRALAMLRALLASGAASDDSIAALDESTTDQGEPQPLPAAPVADSPPRLDADVEVNRSDGGAPETGEEPVPIEHEPPAHGTETPRVDDLDGEEAAEAAPEEGSAGTPAAQEMELEAARETESIADSVLEADAAPEVTNMTAGLLDLELEPPADGAETPRVEDAQEEEAAEAAPPEDSAESTRAQEAEVEAAAEAGPVSEEPEVPEDASIEDVLVPEDEEQSLQVGAFRERETAELIAFELGALTELPIWISPVTRADGLPLHRVRVGPISSEPVLLETAAMFEASGYSVVNPRQMPTSSAPGFGAEDSSMAMLLIREDGEQYLQAGAFRRRETAETLLHQLRELTELPVRMSLITHADGPPLHRVRIGPISSEQALLETTAAFEARGHLIVNPPQLSILSALELWVEESSMETLLIREDGEQFLQAGAFSEREAAETLAQELRALTELPVRISVVTHADGRPLHRVRIGPIDPGDPLLRRLSLED